MSILPCVCACLVLLLTHILKFLLSVFIVGKESKDREIKNQHVLLSKLVLCMHYLHIADFCIKILNLILYKTSTETSKTTKQNIRVQFSSFNRSPSLQPKKESKLIYHIIDFIEQDEQFSCV